MCKEDSDIPKSRTGFAAVQKAEREHDEEVAGLEAERDAIDQQLQAEATRWERERGKLKAALRRARRSGVNLRVTDDVCTARLR